MIVHDNNRNDVYVIGHNITAPTVIRVDKKHFDLAICLIDAFCTDANAITAQYVGEHKIRCIKVIRGYFQCGLKEAKEAFEAAQTFKFGTR